MKVKKAEAQFTPGPWYSEMNVQGKTIVWAFDNPGAPRIAVAAAYQQGKMAHNAALIAAAPELLNACQMAVNEMPGNEQGQKIASMLRAAIAKAEGK